MHLLTILTTAINAIMPIVLLILLGYWLRRIGFLTKEFVKVGNKFVFRACLSCTVFVSVYNIRDFSAIPWNMVLYLIAAVCLLFTIGLGISMATTRVGQRRGVILQNFFRSNYAIIGYPLVAALGGDAAMETAALAAAFVIPLFNILGVVALSLFVRDPGSERHSVKHMLRAVYLNPMVLGALVGLVFVGLRQLQEMIWGKVVFSVSEDMKFLFTPIEYLKDLASPLALVILGAQFEFSAMKGMFKEILVSSLARIVLAPIVGIGLGILLNRYTDFLSLGPSAYPTLIAVFASPTAVSSAVMAGEMGSDEQLATQAVVWSSIGSVFTIFLLVCLLMAAGFLTV